MRLGTDRRLREVAATYVIAVLDGKPPTQAVAADQRTTHSHAANLVHRARKAGYLEPTKRGRPSAPKRRA